MAVADTMRPPDTFSWTWTGPNSVSAGLPLTTMGFEVLAEPPAVPGVVDGDTIPAGGAVFVRGPEVLLFVLVG
jgi:hypothetical protein